MNTLSHGAVETDLKGLMNEFFRAVSFAVGEKPAYLRLHDLFIESGLLIKNSGPSPEIATLAGFIGPRQASVDSGELTRFREAEITQTTDVFGNVAQRFSAYVKFGMLRGVPFEARGMIATQFILTPAGWKISSMAWDDERPGLNLPKRYEPTEFGSAT